MHEEDGILEGGADGSDDTVPNNALVGPVSHDHQACRHWLRSEWLALITVRVCATKHDMLSEGCHCNGFDLQMLQENCGRDTPSGAAAWAIVFCF